MIVVVGIAVAVALVSLAFAAKCYVELWKWAKLCQGAQIAVAYKGKVKLTAPIVEWVLWTQQLTGKEEKGRTVYSLGGTQVALIRKDTQQKRKPFRVRMPQRKGAVA